MRLNVSVQSGIIPPVRTRGQFGAVVRITLPIVLALQSSLSYSQAVPDSGQILQSVPQTAPRNTQELQLEQRLRQSKSVTDVEGMRIEIKGFRLTGLTNAPEAEVQKELASFLGANRNFQTLLDAAAKVKEVLARNGLFLADAIIPQQRIQNGVVEILVLEGKLGKVKVEYDKDVKVNHALVESYASTLKPGSFISAEEVERALFLISDLKGIQVRSAFEPGETVGTSDLTIRISKGKEVDANLDLDANGSIYTGVLRAGVGFDVNNLAGRGDLLSLRFTSALENFDTSSLQYARLSYLMPIGSWGTKIGGSFSSLRYKLGTPTFLPLKASGAAEVRSLIAIHPVVRSRNSNLLLSYQYDQRIFHDVQEATARTTDKETSINTYGLSGDFRDNVLGGGINVYNVGHTVGRLAFQTDALRAADLAGHFTGGNYRKTNASFSRLQSVVDRLALYGTFSIQAASRNLDPSEKISLGGPSAVRAYPQGEGAGDEGYYGTVEARYRLPNFEKLPGTMVVTAFHDFGWSRLNKNPLAADLINTRKIAGAGIGLNWEKAGDWAVRTSLAVQETARAQAEHVIRNPRMYITFSKYF